MKLEIKFTDQNCDYDCPFLDTHDDFCYLFKEKIEYSQIKGWRRCSACRRVSERQEENER